MAHIVTHLSDLCIATIWFDTSVGMGHHSSSEDTIFIGHDRDEVKKLIRKQYRLDKDQTIADYLDRAWGSIVWNDSKQEQYEKELVAYKARWKEIRADLERSGIEMTLSVGDRVILVQDGFDELVGRIGWVTEIKNGHGKYSVEVFTESEISGEDGQHVIYTTKRAWIKADIVEQYLNGVLPTPPVNPNNL